MSAKKTGDYSFGGALLFERRCLGAGSDARALPGAGNAGSLQRSIQPHGRRSSARRSASHAQLGVKTCIGTESPLILPKALRERLKAQGKNPDDPATVREVYEGMFRRIAASHPLDYFWIWTPEGWTWGGNKPEQYADTVSDVKLADRGAKGFRRAVSSWRPAAGCLARSTIAPPLTPICPKTSR